MRFRCEAPLPTAAAPRPVPARLLYPAPDEVLLAGVTLPSEATHRIVLAAGYPLITHLPERDRVISAELGRVGYWEYPESMLLLALAREGMTCLDVGANVGYYSVLLAHAVGRSGRVVAFEPEPDNFRVLLANLLLRRALAPGLSSFRAYRCAVADAVGEADLNVFGDNLGFHSLVHAAGARLRTTVQATTIDRLRGLDGGGAALLGERIGLIKADIQGGELRLLRGATRVLRADRPLLCLELEPYIAGDRACLDLVEGLAAAGYGQFRVFHSNATDPAGSLRELARVLTGPEVAGLIAARQVGPYGTIFAVPDARGGWRAGPG